MVDILKVLAVLSALLYLNRRAKSRVSTTNYRIMNAGLSLLLFASILDFTDGFRALDKVPVIGQRAPFHDILEDQVGDMPGFTLFALGAFREIMRSEPVAKLTSGDFFKAPKLALTSLLNTR